MYHDILKQVEDEIPSSPSNEDSDNLSPDVTECKKPFSSPPHAPPLYITHSPSLSISPTDLQYFSNYNDISRLVDPVSTCMYVQCIGVCVCVCVCVCAHSIHLIML